VANPAWLPIVKKSSTISFNTAVNQFGGWGDQMKDATRVTLVFSSLIYFTSAAFGQTASTVAQQPAPSAASKFTCQASFGPPMPLTPPGPAAPYSAVQETSSVQTLADGTHIARKPMTENIYRDSEGRTRTERAFCLGSGGTPDAMVIEIRDPVSGYSYILDEQNQVAHRFAIQVRRPGDSAVRTANIAPAQAPIAAASPQESLRPTVTTESLGTQSMEGVLVEGTRTTRIIPEGLQGNDRPITVVSEVWRSPELKIAVLIKTNDPRNGEMTTRLTNIELSNPILSLFQPPSEYKIVDESAYVTLTFTRN
jgi:hypothetical protein